jgi:N-acetylmuramoyl-L-alanine amidase
MRNLLKLVTCFCLALVLTLGMPVFGQSPTPLTELFISHPPNNHQTSADRIYFIGSAPPGADVTINGQKIDLTPARNFAPTLPLQPGTNTFRIRQGAKEIVINVNRTAGGNDKTVERGFEESSRQPRAAAATPGESPCNTSTASSRTPAISGNLEAVTDPSTPQAIYGAGRYLGCAVATAAANIDRPTSPSSTADRQPNLPPTTVAAVAPLPEPTPVLDIANREVARVKASSATARTGPSSDFSRLTPLPRGTRAYITEKKTGDNNGKPANWLRLDYGGWVNAEDIDVLANATSPKSAIDSIRTRSTREATEILFPLQSAVPITVEQGDRLLNLTLYNTVARGSTFQVSPDATIDRLNWQQLPQQRVRYQFALKNLQQWGYRLRYEGNTLVFSVRHRPKVNPAAPLSGLRLAIDPGHGGTDSGAIGGNGYKEKDAALYLSKLLANELAGKGAQVFLTRQDDRDLSLAERIDLIDRIAPHASFSIHYNSIPDGANPMEFQGFSSFWYHPQSQSLAIFMARYASQVGVRQDRGVLLDNLALVRPTIAPATLLEVGFMSHPQEIEWISNPSAQQQMAKVLASGIEQWFASVN